MSRFVRVQNRSRKSHLGLYGVVLGTVACVFLIWNRFDPDPTGSLSTLGFLLLIISFVVAMISERLRALEDQVKLLDERFDKIKPDALKEHWTENNPTQ